MQSSVDRSPWPLDRLALVKGAGDLASGVAHRLHCCGLRVVMTELNRPTMVRRSVSFGEAVYAHSQCVEGVMARLAANTEEAAGILACGEIAVMVDADAAQALALQPAVVVDAIMAKHNTGTRMADAPLVIGLGPGFTAGRDLHAVVETQRGLDLGRVIWKGAARQNTGMPAPVKGYTIERLLRSPAEGVFTPAVKIGDIVRTGDVIGYVGNAPLRACIDGVLRGLLKGGLYAVKGFKMGDIEPGGDVRNCYKISDKARAVAGGVLEAILAFHHHRNNVPPLWGNAARASAGHDAD